MKKDLLKLLATVTVAGLLVGCGSSSSDNDTTGGDDNTSTPTVPTTPTGGDDNTSTPTVPTTPTSNITLDDNKLMFDGKELTLSGFSVKDTNITSDDDSSMTYLISSLYFDGNQTLSLLETNATIGTSVTLSDIAEEPINQPVDGYILPSFQ